MRCAAGIALLGRMMSAHALECGAFQFPQCSAADRQYAGGFAPHAGFGGFGGGDCTAQRTPVVFIHGNADRAVSWDSPAELPANAAARAGRSVYDELRARGYNDCELFGVTYLSRSEQRAPQANFHRPEKYRILGKFIEAVKNYSRKAQVDIVAHSLGVSMALASLTYHDVNGKPGAGWRSVRRFVNIAGGVRGLNSCLYAGLANAALPTCGSQNLAQPFIFGFYPDSGSMLGANQWTGRANRFSMRDAPARQRDTAFYTIHAGVHDQVHCTTLRGGSACAQGALFSNSVNVRAQLNVGSGASAQRRDFDFSDWSPFARQGGDQDGVGHFKARNNLGAVIYEMLNTDCRGLDCRGSYSGHLTAKD